MSDVVVVDYDPLWPRVFEQLRQSVWSAVGDIAIAIEHVGSTAVPGLAAKPVIDMDIVVRDAADVANAISRLATIGYAHRGDLGIPGREAFARPPGSPSHHLYVCRAGSVALANHLGVRDYLRANPATAERYGALKRRLAREFAHDMDGYIEGKTGLLTDILRTVGLDSRAVADIERMNERPHAAS